ncbi:hypothetical protein BCR42DRAFT_463617 [Absidia repens]|uniref:Phospholipid/glycerol acyltransferase domain-containing protein n=1 Tax=Absidia repens TaxID=90262 RepID=A0A1X2HKH3_9FUNG|nr:hypothetical protein BCR42DRAFT_463617 [Absidia repens]
MTMNELSPAAVTYGVVSSAFRAVSHIFFREIKTSGSHHVPQDSPVIFLVGPHHSQFVDGVVFFGVNPRPSYALMAAVSYNRPLIGHFGKILNAIPVVRPQDAVEKGTGMIMYDSDTQPFTIYGQNTKFTEELNTRDFILFGRNHKVHVAKVISDTECEITHTVKVDMDDNNKKQASYSFKIAPHVDQTPVYTEVNHYLNNNECITIFPEGGSHDRSEMLPLKAGFAVMALGALAEYPDMDLKIVPVGLNYFHPDKFRSRVVVSYGQPLSIDRKDVELFKQGGKSKREAVTKLMDQSDEAFKLVTTSAPTYEALMVMIVEGKYGDLGCQRLKLY